MIEMQNDYKLVGSINEQLQINQLQINQLESLSWNVSRKARAYLISSCILANALVAVGLLFLPEARHFVPDGFTDLFPAVFVFIVFGVYQTVSIFYQASNTARELRLLLHEQEMAVSEAKDALISYEHTFEGASQ